MSEQKVPYDPFENMTGDDLIEALNPKNWTEIQRLHTPTLDAILHDGKLTLTFPAQPAGWELERSEVEALTRFLNQYAGVDPLPAPTDPFENFQPTSVEPESVTQAEREEWARQHKENEQAEKAAKYNADMDERNRIRRENIDKPWLPLYDGE